MSLAHVYLFNSRAGPSEFTITGPMRDWTAIPDLPKIKVPTLVLNGNDEGASDAAVAPLFQRIPHVKWFTFANSTHMPHLEEREKWMSLVSDFLWY